MNKENWKTRGLKPGDIPYITSTWMNSFRSNARWPKEILHRIYSSEHNRIINSILNNSQVLIACDPEDEDHIFGYVVFSNITRIDLDIFHYVFTKRAFQKLGVAKGLIKESRKGGNAAFTHKNEKAKWIPEKLLSTHYENVNFNPYLFFKEV